MNTSVNIGSSQEFRLSRALLVYGKSSYDGFPYRHPFITAHEVIHEHDGARLAEGHLVTPQMLIDLVSSLGRALPLEILPGRVLVRTENVLVWWSPARQRRMFFGEHVGQARGLNGKIYPHPSLLYKATNGHLWIRALGNNRRPSKDTGLFMAPYWNCYDNAAVCTGSMRIPEEKTIAVIDLWEESFFQSEFTHPAGVRRHTLHPGGFVQMWESLAGEKRFPTRYLVSAKQTVAEFVNDHDQSYRNQN